MPDYSAQLTPEDRWAVAAYIRALQLSQAATAADVPAGVQVQDLKDIAAAEGHPEYAQPWALPATAVQAYPHDTSEGTPGNGSGATRPTRRSRFQQANRPPQRPRSKDANGMAHESHAHQDASRRPQRSGLCRRLEDARAHGGRGLLGHRRDPGVPGQSQDQLGCDHLLRAWVLGLMLTFGWSRRRPGAADGAVLLRRQVGPAAAPAAGGHEPHAAAGLRLLGRRRHLQ